MGGILQAKHMDPGLDPPSSLISHHGCYDLFTLSVDDRLLQSQSIEGLYHYVVEHPHCAQKETEVTVVVQDDTAR